MKYGLFMMPSHPPERDVFQAHQWDLDCLELADNLGFDEAWIGEHFTSPWEPIPAPDLMIAQALMRTKNIKLATGVHLLPYHHPAELAHRVAYSPIAWPTWTTWRRAVSCSALAPEGCPATMLSSTLTVLEANTGT